MKNMTGVLHQPVGGRNHCNFSHSFRTFPLTYSVTPFCYHHPQMLENVPKSCDQLGFLFRKFRKRRSLLALWQSSVHTITRCTQLQPVAPSCTKHFSFDRSNVS